MITAITGLLGGGKSYTEVVLMYEALKSGIVVGTNIDLNVDNINKIIGARRRDVWQKNYHFLDIGGDENGNPGKNDDPRTWPCGDRRGTPGQKKSLVVIDESAEWLDAYYPGATGRVEQICSWLRHSDKLGVDVHLIIQHPTMLHKRARALVHFWCICTDMGVWRVPGLGLKCPYPFNQFVHRMMYDRDAKTPVGGNGRFFPKEQAYYGLYDTAAMFGVSRKNDSIVATVAEQKVNQTWWEKPGIYPEILPYLIGALLS